jgi:hypothetical protein
MEFQWKKKRDVVWWRGATVGGGSSPPGLDIATIDIGVCYAPSVLQLRAPFLSYTSSSYPSCVALP